MPGTSPGLRWQVLDEEELIEHAESIRNLVQGSLGSPATDSDDDGSEECLERESKEQFDTADFTQYLKLKSSGLELLTGFLANGIADLEKRFVNKQTHLGAGDADFVRFVDVPVYPKEAREP